MFTREKSHDSPTWGVKIPTRVEFLRIITAYFSVSPSVSNRCNVQYTVLQCAAAHVATTHAHCTPPVLWVRDSRRSYFADPIRHWWVASENPFLTNSKRETSVVTRRTSITRRSRKSTPLTAIRALKQRIITADGEKPENHVDRLLDLNIQTACSSTYVF